MVIDGLEKSIDELKEDIERIHWYDGDWFMEEAEPISAYCISKLHH